MKRELPDLEALAQWASENLEPGEKHSSRGLWLHWLHWSQREGAEPGSPSSFRNELRKLGYPVVREPGRRKKYHQGIRLRWPDLTPGAPLAQCIAEIDAILEYER